MPETQLPDELFRRKLAKTRLNQVYKALDTLHLAVAREPYLLVRAVYADLAAHLHRLTGDPTASQYDNLRDSLVKQLTTTPKMRKRAPKPRQAKEPVEVE